jgi:hypothetical protein
MHERIHHALSRLKEIESAFSTMRPGPDLAAKQRLEALLFRVQFSDAYVNEKRGKLGNALAVFFSARKWQSYAGGENGVRMEVGRNIRSLVEHLEHLAKNET